MKRNTTTEDARCFTISIATKLLTDVGFTVREHFTWRGVSVSLPSGDMVRDFDTSTTSRAKLFREWARGVNFGRTFPKA